MVAHSNILSWRIPPTEEPSGSYRPWGCKESDMTKRLSTLPRNAKWAVFFMYEVEERLFI